MIRKLLALVLVAVAVRAACVYAVRAEHRTAGAWLHSIHAQPGAADERKGPGGLAGPWGHDALEFNGFALDLAQGVGYGAEYPSSFRAPGFPLCLAAVYAVTGENYAAAYAFFCLLGAASCVAAFLLARELMPQRGALVTGLFCAIYFPYMYYATCFYSENLFVPCLGFGLWLLVRFLKSGSRWCLALSALLLGWSALTRPFALLLLPLLGALVAVSEYRRAKGWVLPAAIFGLLFLAPIAPWTARNYLIHDAFVLIATNGGSTFYGGNNDIVLNEWPHQGGWVSTGKLPHRDLIEAAPSEVEHDRVEWRLGVSWVREHASDLPLLGLYKLIRLALPDLDSANRMYVLLQIVGGGPFLVLIAIGAVRSLTSRAFWTLPWLALQMVMLATIVTSLIFWGSPRFRDANAVVLMVYAVVGLQVLVPRLVRKSRAETPHKSVSAELVTVS